MNKLIITLLSFCITQSTYANNTANSQAPVADTSAPLTLSTPAVETVKALYPSFADIVEPLIPAVVNIYTTKYNKRAEKIQRTPFPEGFPFDQFHDFFEQYVPYEESYSNSKAVSLGSGFIIDPAGFIVTNHHVIKNADKIHVKLLDNTELAANLIGSDQRTDLALLQVAAKAPLPFVKFGDSGQARVGDWIITIGNPFCLGSTVTTGIISSKGRDLELDAGGIVDDYIQTDAAINSGSSGGPMFNINGEIIGVNTAIFSPSGTNVGIGFAIPSNTARNVIEQLKKNGKISRGRLDISIQEVTSEISEGFNLKETTGALVREVVPGGAGDKAGLKVGDVIIEFAGQPVKSARKLQVLVAESPINKEVKILVVRAGKNIELTANILESTKDENPVTSSDKPETSKVKAGSLKKNNITFSNLTDELRQKFNIKDQAKGVVITSITKDLKNFALKVGDLVIEANQQPISSVEQLNTLYESLKFRDKKNIVLFIKRQNTNIFVALPVE